MKYFINNGLLFCGCIFIAWLAILQLGGPDVTHVSMNLLGPWLDLCQFLTPEAWQVQGNILLGLSWLFSGVIVYALGGSVIFSLLIILFGRQSGRV